MALRAPRRAHRTADPVAGHQLAAPRLRRGDVDVIVGDLVGIHAQEAGAVDEQLDDSLGDPLRRGLGLRAAGDRDRVAIGIGRRAGVLAGLAASVRDAGAGGWSEPVARLSPRAARRSSSAVASTLVVPPVPRDRGARPVRGARR